ncbi:hypothetical protein PIB30_098987, partial [Stylosanthes scabra]|nr:hypothetical protein [Stylosanthes scabra]
MGVLMKIITAALLEKISQWSKPTIWEISKGSPTMILMPILTIQDRRTTLTLVREGTKIQRATTSKTVHLTNRFQDHHFNHHFHNNNNLIYDGPDLHPYQKLDEGFKP